MQMAQASTVYLLGINNSGQIVGYVGGSGTSTNSDFIYNYPSGVLQYVSALGNGTLTYTAGINDSGQVVGSQEIGTTLYGFLYSGGVYTYFNPPGGISTYPEGINNSGAISGTYYANGENFGVGFVDWRCLHQCNPRWLFTSLRN
jgi:hypothetical protein